MSRLHDDLIVIDGLIISKWSRSVFEDMRLGGLTAANCTCSVWEGFQGTMDNIIGWKRMLRDNADIITQVHRASDIRAAKEAGKVGIILGFQNTDAFEGEVGYVELFRDIGVGIAQMTYNTQNMVGTGCYESRDCGLSDFGREIVAEMNRVGMMCDLSHVGPQTSHDVILASKKPVTYSHCLPSGLKAHPRNKSDEELRLIADRGGFVGVTMFPPFLAQGGNAVIDDYVAAIEYVINIVGEDSTGIGTDFTQDQDKGFFDYLCLDKGRGRRLVTFTELVNPKGLQKIGEFPNLTEALERAKWPESRIRKVLGENWLRVFSEVWGD
jgi:membrane dipeptidase